MVDFNSFKIKEISEWFFPIPQVSSNAAVLNLKAVAGLHLSEPMNLGIFEFNTPWDRTAGSSIMIAIFQAVKNKTKNKMVIKIQYWHWHKIGIGFEMGDLQILLNYHRKEY